MTIFGWDASHYDGVLTLADLQRAHAEGIDFFTHKLGEGLDGEDPTQGTALAAARDAGIPILGGYWFCHNDDDPFAEARACVAMADKDESWWRTFPCWFWQPDCETETGHGKPTKGWIETFADELSRLTGRVEIVYGSHGQYGDTLAGLGHHLWNANYPSSRQAPFRDLYPGDSYAGWNPYSGQTPVLCQYASSATIAGKTTCDANAFRGTVTELQQLLGGTNMTTAYDTWGLNPPAGVTNPADCIANPTQRRAEITGEKDNLTTTAGFALGDTWQQVYNLRDLVRALGTGISALGSAVAGVLTQSRSNGSGISQLLAASSAGASVSDADKDDIARRVADLIVGSYDQTGTLTLTKKV